MRATVHGSRTIAATAMATLLVAGCGGGDGGGAGFFIPAAGPGGPGGGNGASPPGTPIAVAPFSAAVDCSAMKALSIANTTITSAELIPAGSYKPPASSASFDNLPEFCRVVAKVTPLPGSSIGIEVWLPSKSWNGRYQQVGTHGTGGNIYWSEMAPQLRRGFATGATDTGHEVPLTVENRGSIWAIGYPERINDYGYRAVHELVDKAKAAIRAYYGRQQDYAYFNGCSKGGQDGLKSAQAYPGDFNGIIAGGVAGAATQAATAQLVQDINLRAAGIQGAEGTRILQLAQKSAIEACDTIDGVKDGFLTNPSRCNWNPAKLLCAAGQDPASCITQPQADALARQYQPVVDPVTQEKIFFGLTRGSEHDWIRFGHQNALSSYSLSLYQIAMGDPNWNGSTFDLHRDFPILRDRLAAAVDAVDPNLEPFKKAGGKLIQWHTWDDSAFMPQWATDYYDQVSARLGGTEATGDFYRLFMMPAQGHCAGDGVGPSNFGQENALAVSDDADHDVVTALQSWVEKGVAPRKFIVSRLKNNDAKQGIEMQRPICAYPLEAVYKGTGDTSAAENFTCSTPVLSGL